MADMVEEDTLAIGGKTYSSRLFLGSGKFSSHQAMQKAIEHSQTPLVTMALRRIDVADSNDAFMRALQESQAEFLPNTSGARNANQAVRLARLAAAALGHRMVKLELTPEPKHLLPDPVETLKAATELAKDGFEVYPYMNADPVLAKRLEEAGCVCVMPLGAAIGTNAGLRTIDQLRIIIENANVPVVIDAGLGQPSHAAAAMEIGADAVLVNTAIATAENPALAAEGFRLAVLAGRLAFKAIMAGEKPPEASSPQQNLAFLSEDF